ncbi:chorismate mutase [Kosakonia cowanii]|uniref:chorismate mutase n=1 Tax=Kosakonia cowanii TaxID=208223 RepID=UPI003A5C10CC
MDYKFYSAVVMLATLSFSAAAAVTADASLGKLINERLSWMKDVAGAKAQQHQAIEDLAQEQKVLARAVIDAEALGLDGESVKPFIQAQMDAAKAIQYRYRADWLATPETNWQPRPLDEVRKQISELSDRILRKVAERLKASGKLTEADREEFMRTVQQHNLTGQDKAHMWQALESISLKA